MAGRNQHSQTDLRTRTSMGLAAERIYKFGPCPLRTQDWPTLLILTPLLVSSISALGLSVKFPSSLKAQVCSPASKTIIFNESKPDARANERSCN